MPIQNIADFVRHASIPDAVRECAADALADALTCAMAAAACSDPLLETLIRHGLDQGGTPESSILTQPLHFPAQNAARINAAAIHTLDFDDTTLTSWIGHPSAVLYGALLAIASRELATTGEVLDAWAIGFEIGARLGEAGGHEAYERGWHNTATIGAVAGAAAAARLLRLDPDHIRAAINLAATMSGGLKVAFGSDGKAVQVGQAAASAVLASNLAARGLGMADDALFAERGWLEAFGAPTARGRARLEAACNDLGERWDCLSPGLAWKLWPCCAYTHWAIDAALTLRERIPSPAAIAAITLHASDTARATCRHDRPQTPRDARFSLPATTALALAEGWPAPHHFLADTLPDETLRLLALCRYEPPVVGLPDWGGRLTVELDDDTTFSETVETPRGHQQRPPTDEDRQRKYVTALQPLGDTAAALPDWAELRSLTRQHDGRIDTLLTATTIRHG